MAQAVRFRESGAPEVLRVEDPAAGEPGPGDIRLRHAACDARAFDLVATGRIEVEIGRRHAIDACVEAHRNLEAGRSIGSTVCIG